MKRTGTKLLAALAALFTIGIVAVAQAATGDTYGKSSLEQRIQPDGNPGFNYLETTAGENYTVRDGTEDGGVALGEAKAGRDGRRTAISYFGQLTDFQLADEESPLRVEFLDPMGGSYSAAWRPQEALAPFEIDQMMRQFNYFADHAPTAAGNGSLPKMDFVMNTGDISDNNQYNETLWNRQIMEGGTVNPNSGVNPAPYLGSHPLCPNSIASAVNGMDPAKYQGVQDRSLWPPTSKPGHLTDPAMGYFWDPDEPNPAATNPQWVNPYADAPSYPGLMNRAQEPFTAAGLKVPGYVLFGNHDALVQGNKYGAEVYNQIATGCLKPIDDDEKNSGRPNGPLLGMVLDNFFSAQKLLDLYGANPDYFMPVPPDPNRRLLSRPGFMDLYKSGKDKQTGHGFKFIDKDQASASHGYAGYYSFSPRPGIRYIVLDTTAAGGKYPGSDEGNLDNPQFQWFESKLKLAKRNNELAVVFSHHAFTSLTANVLDENAPSCRNVNVDVIPGCDGDPRGSAPIRLAADAKALMLKYPNAIAWVAGHSHVNRIKPYTTVDGKSGFWSIQTSALADWPKQNRLLQLFDNRDGTLSIFGTLVDDAAPVDPPAPGSNAAGFTPEQMASVARTVGFNDSQSGRACAPNLCGEGEVRDRNAELLIRDPRKAQPIISSVKISPKARSVRAGGRTTLTVAVTNFSTATAAAKKVRVTVKSGNRQVKVKKTVTIAKIEPGRTAKVKITVRTTRKARGKAKITVTAAGRKAVSTIKVKPPGKRKR